MKLSELKPATGSRKRKVRVGRGEGSGHGKTSGRGGKGQTARTGGRVRAGFEGGQMPLYRRISKVGFRSQRRILGNNCYDVINVGELERIFDSGATVTLEAVVERGYGRTASTKAGLKVLGNGDIKKALTIKVAAFSESARKKIEAAGGKVELLSAGRE